MLSNHSFNCQISHQTKTTDIESRLKILLFKCSDLTVVVTGFRNVLGPHLCSRSTVMPVSFSFSVCVCLLCNNLYFQEPLL